MSFNKRYPVENGAPGGITRCTSNGDPHFMTFDGRRYDNYRIGDWVMVNNDRRDFAVRLFFICIFLCEFRSNLLYLKTVTLTLENLVNKRRSHHDHYPKVLQ